jgi:copper chaperone
MIKLKIEGATCNGCVSSIEKSIQRVEGVQSATFSLDEKILKVEGIAEKEALIEAIELAGFDVIQ